MTDSDPSSTYRITIDQEDFDAIEALHSWLHSEGSDPKAVVLDGENSISGTGGVTLSLESVQAVAGIADRLEEWPVFPRTIQVEVSEMVGILAIQSWVDDNALPESAAVLGEDHMVSFRELGSIGRLSYTMDMETTSGFTSTGP